jgi:hypothetical protein
MVEPLQFLLGDWVGEGGGGPGQGSGYFSFAPDLQAQVIVRKNHAEYPATQDQPAYQHDDLMIVYNDADKTTRAIYFDNEGHVIRYSVEFVGGRNAVTFLSDPEPSAPRYRLTYTQTAPERVSITFEIAPHDNSQAFATYITSTAWRKE